MSTIAENRGALLPAALANPLVVGPGPDQSRPEGDELVIQVSAVAINPVEWKIQDTGVLDFGGPHVLGSDVAGVVVKLGPGVSRFQVGDRVIGHCLGLVHGGARHGGFQNFTTCREVAAARIPADLPFERAVVLPLSISTSAAGLFGDLGLRLPPPLSSESSSSTTTTTTDTADGSSLPVPPQTKEGDAKETVLIWGGSSSVGSTAVQLAAAAGYAVATTASARNHAYVRSLAGPAAAGDVAVFDQAAPGVNDAIVAHVRSRRGKLAGGGALDCIGTRGTVRACAEILRELNNGGGGGGNGGGGGGGGGGLVVATVNPPPTPTPTPEADDGDDDDDDDDDDVRAVFVNGAAPFLTPGHRGAGIWTGFVGPALAAGRLRAKPEPLVVPGRGLGRVQAGLDLQKKGVSARKVVVLL